MELFHDRDSIYSRTHRAPFTVGVTQYSSVWQYYNFRKAITFEDEKIATFIIENDDHYIQDQLVDMLKKYTRTAWLLLCHDVIFEAYYAKFTQHPDLRSQLFETREKLLVEVSPYDSVWGNGLAYDDICNGDINSWLGGNWCGYVLTQVRESLMAEFSQPSTFVITWNWAGLREDPKAACTVLERVWKNSVMRSLEEEYGKKRRASTSNKSSGVKKRRRKRKKQQI